LPAATLSDSLETNHKTTLTGVMAVAVTPSVELSAQFHQIHYDHVERVRLLRAVACRSPSGDRLRDRDAGTLVLAVDAGAGTAVRGAAFRRSRRRFLYAMLDAPLAPGAISGWRSRARIRRSPPRPSASGATVGDRVAALRRSEADTGRDGPPRPLVEGRTPRRCRLAPDYSMIISSTVRSCRSGSVAYHA
jgi:hypothetical protein